MREERTQMERARERERGEKEQRREGAREQKREWEKERGSEALIVLNYSTDSKAEWTVEASLFYAVCVRVRACVCVCV